MAPASKSSGGSSDRFHRPSSKGHDDDETPSLNLWVGNLSSGTVDSDLMAIFGEFGALDAAVTAQSPRTYAFVYFKRIDDAKKAKDALQGSEVRGNEIQIEFARPAKPGKHLWVGGISPSVTKEKLEAEFLKFGKVEEYKFLRDRNSAYVNYCKMDDALAAQKSMNGKRLAGEQIRVDFQKSQSSRREWADHHDARGSRRSSGPPEAWMSPDGMRNFEELPGQGSRRHMPHGGRKDGPPSNTLWVGYPPTFRMDEQMLHNAMILFGEIERIKSFPSRHYSFVEFRSVDEARRAKEGLQGRLFGDPRIQIMYSCSELGPNKDSAPLLPGYRVPRQEMLLNDTAFGSMDLFASGRSMVPNTFPGHLLPNNMAGPSMLMRPFAPQGFDPYHEGTDYHDFYSPLPSDSLVNNPMASNWRQLSPSPGVLPSSSGMRLPLRPMAGAWEDGFDAREPKRSRIDVSPPNDAPFHGRRVAGEGVGDMFVLPQFDRVVPGQRHRSPVIHGPSQRHVSPVNDHCWRGVIAKGGSTVCHARCVPIGQGIDFLLPEVVNCSARTDLDMLTKHYADATGFEIVFFLPDCEDDFDSYTEFLRYLGTKGRVGVAKLDDGTTLFLVPPSDFLTKVLNVSGPERLYGVVLKFPQQSTMVVTAQRPQAAALPPPPHYSDRQPRPTSRDNYEYFSQNEDPASQMDYGTAYEDSVAHGRVGPSANEPRSVPSAPQNVYASNPAASSQVEVSLTPELIATLASLIPSNQQSSTTANVQIPSSSSVCSASFPANAMYDPSMPLQGWGQGHQPTLSLAQLEQSSDAHQQQDLQQFGQQFSNQAPSMSQYQTYANLPNGPGNSVQHSLGGMQVQDLALTQVSATAPLNNYAMSSQGQTIVPQSNQQYQVDSSYGSYNTNRMSQVTDAAELFHQPAQQQAAHSSSSAQGQAGNALQSQRGLPLTTDQLNVDFSAQMQQLRTALSSSDQGTSQSDADKNQRYQSTLQFAASLLMKIQHQQQQQEQQNGGSQTVQGAGNQC